MNLNYFNFKQFHDKILMTNDFGGYAFVRPDELRQIVAKRIDMDSDLGRYLVERKMIYDESALSYSERQLQLLRIIKGHAITATALHIFVVTTTCNMSCVYCQANNGVANSHLVMDEHMAERAVDIALQSPERMLTFEFQGGEPLINYPVIRHIVEYTETHKGDHQIEYTVVSNLTLMTDEILDFMASHQFGISTSVDGNELVHNRNRRFTDGKGTYTTVCRSIDKIRAAGLHVGAIETTTRYSLAHAREIVNEYADLGFESIFIRPLTPLGKAAMHWDEIGYSADEFIAFYNAALEEILAINKQGRFIKENHAEILLRRIQGDFVNYMELRSPCGAGIGQLAYYADGNVFTCDEGRMLHEMGQSAFLLGNVNKSKYQDLIENGVCRAVCASSVLETIPSCCDCVYQPYCGTCPVVNYAMGGDLLEKEPRGYRCRIYSGILDALFDRFYEENPDIIQILESWCN